MSAFGSLTDINRVSSVRRSNALRNQCQDFGGKSQDRAGPVVLRTPPAQRSEAKRSAIASCRVTVRFQIIQGQTMMEIKIAFVALAFFGAFMAARSLTAYFKQR
jgi:hypothetical protein